MYDIYKLIKGKDKCSNWRTCIMHSMTLGDRGKSLHTLGNVKMETPTWKKKQVLLEHNHTDETVDFVV